MNKPAKSAADLRAMALSDIRRHEGCKSVQSVSVKPIRDDRADCNWSIAVDDLGSADGYLARRIALVVHEHLSARYDLMTDAPDGIPAAAEVTKAPTTPRGPPNRSSPPEGSMQ